MKWDIKYSTRLLQLLPLRGSLFPHFLNLGGLVIFSGQQNVVEMILSEFQSMGLRDQRLRLP